MWIKIQSKWGKCIRTYNYYLNGHKEIPILSLCDCKKIGVDNPIVITVQITEQVVAELEENGFSNVWILPISGNGSCCNGLAKQIYDAKESIDFVYRNLHDERSRALFQCIVGIRCGEQHQQRELAQMESTERYMPKSIFEFPKNAVIIDAGGLDGDTAVEFVERSGYDYQCIYSFEPNPEMLPKLYERNLPRHKIVAKALSSFSGTAHFIIGGNGTSISKGGSKLNDFGNYEVQVISLDSMLPQMLPPTYIKLDIEGSEMEALEGMTETISCYHPILAVCIYHKPLDIFEIPFYLMEKYPFYRFYIRHHSKTNYDTVLYCIPPENE